MPVELRVDGGANVTVSLNATGALPTTVAMSGRSHAIVQMLLLRPDAHELTWRDESNPKTHGVLAIQAQSESADLPNVIAGIDAYSPAFAWHPGAPARVRRVIMLSAILVSIALIASVALIQRRRLQIIAALGVIAFATIGIEIWRRQISPIWRAGGQIVVQNDDGTMQIDTWQYLTARSPSQASVEIAESTWPVFVDEPNAKALGASLQFDAAKSTLTLNCNLDPGMKLAVCSRKIVTNASSSPATRATSAIPKSPLTALAQRLYVNADTSIVGEGEVEWIDDQTIRWPSIILRQRSRH